MNARSRPHLRVHHASFITIACIPVFALAGVLAAAQHDHHATSEAVPALRFATSCKPSVGGMVERGVALLHAFSFDEAIATFKQVAHSDVDCAMAWWGVALSQWGDPFDGRPSSRMLSDGAASIARGAAARKASARERMYLAAVSELYRNTESTDEITRTRAYQRAMARLSERYPEDVEGRVFAALALGQLAGSDDEVRATRVKAAAALEEVLRTRPGHPGAIHYLVRLYDHPSLASKGLDLARAYREIAPSTPSALHAASRIFSRLGMWAESIDANLASADAARRDRSVGTELRALDYQLYAYLQTGEERKATAILQRVDGRDHDILDSGIASTAAVTLAAMRARYALERRDWPGAASLVDPSTGSPAEVMTVFARGIGLARLGRFQPAQRELERLGVIRETLRSAGAWIAQVDVYRGALEAWIRRGQEQSERALSLLTAAAAIEDQLAMPFDSPGPLAPAREMLAEMLLELNRPREAKAAFEQALKARPNRRHAVIGLARVADVIAAR